MVNVIIWLTADEVCRVMAKTSLAYHYENYRKGLQDVQKRKRRKQNMHRALFFMQLDVWWAVPVLQYEMKCVLAVPLDFREKIAITV